MGAFHGFLSTYIILVAVTCSQFENLRASLLGISQEQETQRLKQENGLAYEVDLGSMQEKINACMLHHQKIIKLKLLCVSMLIIKLK